MFDYRRLAMVSLDPNTLTDATGRAYSLCQNEIDHGVCNWLPDEPGLCFACQFNRTIPNLSQAHNLVRWQRLEAAKKRLIYTLLSLNLPLQHGWQHSDGLLFDFLADERSDPGQFAGQVANTGYLGGVITINVLEADDAARELERTALNEPYRTLLGHMRHESGHHYAEQILGHSELAEHFARHFGDPSANYTEALERHYEQGPPASWAEQFVSAYASSHPLEDFAETWSHYLHMQDALETAAAQGALSANRMESADFAERIALWRSLSMALNELNRSIGHADAYPFVISDGVADKLQGIEQMVASLAKAA